MSAPVAVPYADLAAALSAITSRVRTDITAVKRSDGRQSWTKEALTPERMARHLNGGPARGVCPIKAGESVTLVGLLDLDSHSGETSWHEMARAGALILESLEFIGGRPIAFRSSGGRGIHVYCLWEGPQDAYSVRQWLAEGLRLSGFAPGISGVAAGEVEVFPKQDSVPVDGNGSQFILPLAGASVPLEFCDLAGILMEATGGREAVLGAGWTWPLSAAVPVMERPVRAANTGSNGAGGAGLSAELLDALGALNVGERELSYDEWRNVVFALHHETGGSADGLSLAHEVSARSMLYDPAFLDERVWPYVRSDRDSTITGRTILALARGPAGGGWVPALDSSAFSAVLVAPGGAGVGVGLAPLPPPTFSRDRSGAILPTATNAVLAVRRADLIGWRIAHDEFTDDTMIADAGAPEGEGWRRINDADMVRLRMAAESLGFKAAPKELVREAVINVCDENRFDSAQVWLGKQEWDGTPRIEGFFERYFGCEGTEYVRAVGLYLWTALAGRVLDPGCQADMAPILEGDQGLRKSSAIAAMVPSRDFFAEVDLAAREDDTSRRLRGVLVGEIAELRGLHTRDEDAIKKFITRTHEHWVPKWKEYATCFPRRCVFIGTVNPKTAGFLADETGNRRWLPLHVSRADVEGIEKDREQLWAEAAAVWRARGGAGKGVAWQDAERLAAPEHEKYMIVDDWEKTAAGWLMESDLVLGDADSGIVARTRGETPFTVAEVAAGAFNIPLKDVDMRLQFRIGAILRRLGYEKRNLMIKGVQGKYWVPKNTPVYPLKPQG